jgi:C1A family cysteine protease
MAQHVFGLKPSKLDGTEKVFNHDRYMSMDLPVSFDMRPSCPPVYDQGQEGSCTANAGCGARVMLAKDTTLGLSRAFLYYMERSLEGNTGEDSGASMKDIGVATQQYGICPEVDMPYSDSGYTTAPSDKATADALAYKISGSKMVTGIDGIKTALFVRNQPVLMGMTVYESMESETTAKTGVLPMPKADEQVMGGHAVLIVGYTDKLPDSVAASLPEETPLERFLDMLFGKKQPSGYFIVRNSWGVQWGDGGYFYMPYEYVTKGYANEFWIINK